MKFFNAKYGFALTAVMFSIAVNHSTNAQTIVPGSTPAEFSVNSGSANYNVPIEVAPGRGGMQPELSLNYSSNGSNGILGVGWNLGGLSGVSRCGRTFAQDGAVGGVSFDGNSRFCLNGQRLISVGNREYRTELDGYAKITSHNGTWNNPGYWLVKTKAGQVMYFGNDANARTSVAQGHLSWSIRTITDTTGQNNVQFNYIKQDGISYLDRIHYVGGAVNFYYENRPDISTGYILGSGFTAKRRIKTIITRILNNEVLKEYRLGYQNSGLRKISALNRLQVCAPGNQCYTPTNFTWQIADYDINGFPSRVWNAVTPQHIRNGDGNREYQPLTGDFNGDGRTDVATISKNGGGGWADWIAVELSTGNGFQSRTWRATTPIHMRNGNAGRDYQSLIGDFNGDGLTDIATITKNGGGGWADWIAVELSTGSGFRSQTWRATTPIHMRNGNAGRDYQFLTGDFNGDGLTDIATISKNGGGGWADWVAMELSTGNGFRSQTWRATTPIHMRNGNSGRNYQFVTGDFNGDGLTDIATVSQNGGGGWAHWFAVELSTGSGFASKTWNATTTQHMRNGGSGNSYKPLVGDFNGDGLDDIVTVSQNGGGGWANWFAVELSTGNGFASKAWTATTTQHMRNGGANNRYYPMVADFNADGISDIVTISPNGAGGWANWMAVELSSGNGFLSRTWNTTTPIHMRNGNGGRSYYPLLGDYNGDGRADVATLSPNGGGAWSQWLAIELSHAPTSHQITEIRSNVLQPTRIFYDSLMNPSIYKKGSVATYPYRNIVGPVKVVKEVKTDDGLGGLMRVQYRYEGLKSHLRGRGLLGYNKITEIYPETGKTLESTYYQHGGAYERASASDSGYKESFPFIGMPLTEKEKYQNKLVNESIYYYSQNVAHSGFNNGKLFQVKDTTKRDKSYELNGSLITEVVTARQQIDAFGNPKRVVSHSTGAGKTFTKITDSIYTNDATKWHLGRLTRSITTHRAPGEADRKRRVEFKYNAQGLLSEEKVVSVANAANWLTLTQHAYNAHGQKTQSTTRAPGQANRVTKFTYDGNGRLSQTCNVYNECSTNTYNAKSRLASSTGPNGLTTRWQYDNFGRTVREDRADNTWTTTQYAFANSSVCAPHNDRRINTAYSCVVSQSKGSPKSVVQFDKLGRTVRTVKKGFDGRLAYSDTQYDRFGRVKQVSRDYYDGEYIYWATSQYDALDRVTRATQPGPHGSVTEIETSYNGLSTTTYSGPDRKARTKKINALGKTVRVDEPLGTYTEYTYYADGNLKTTRNSGNNGTLITIKYDEFGRKIESKDPSLGTWKYQYNGFGEITKQTNAKNQVATLTYDKLGRLIKRVEPEGTSTWTYSSTTAPAGSRGKLIQEKAPGIIRDFSYDSLGRSDSISTTITGAGTFTVETSYDGNGRIRRTTYPGNSGFFTENIYNNNGYLTVVRGLRNHAQSHDYDQLKPLISKANATANEYLAKANKLRSIGRYYQQQIAYYKSLAGSGRVNTAMQNQLKAHRTQLNNTINQGNHLDPKFLGHLNQAIAELEAVNQLLSHNSRSYTQIAEQLTVLAAQTLAVADHNFRYQRATARVASYYNNNNLFGEGSTWLEYWRAADVDASGRISAEVYGNGIVNDYTYNQGTGQLEAINSSLLVVDALRHLEYEYDAYDNVAYRHDLVNDIREDYTYDGLDRLKSTRVQSDLYNTQAFNHTQSLNYNKLGNITHKSDVGNYSYANGASPYRLTKAGNNTYQYDANGNMTRGAGRSFAWTSYNKAKSITQSGRKAEFKYGADRARFQKINHKGDKTYYIGKLYEETRKANGVNEKRHTVYAGGAPIAEHIISSKDGTQTRYLHKDALGSIDLITDTHAEVVDRRSYDAWGKLRDLPWKQNASLNDPLYLTQLPFTNKGYTGHEQIQEVDLINMNGRLYDATLGRFVSADPHIQSPELTQNYNRYSYVLNNPMKYTDPSGFFFKKLFRAIKKVFKKVVSFVKQFAGTIAAIALAAVGCIICTSAILNAGLVGAISGAIGAAANGGNILRGFISGGITGLASSFIGGANQLFGKARNFDLGRAIAHGVVGGTVSVINGGKFGAGFLSSAFTKYVSGPIQGFANRVAATTGIASEIVGAAGAALVGGTASVLGGGKFANGAQTAAIQYLFNQVAIDYERRIRNARQAENAEASRQQNLRREVVSGRVYASYEDDYYVLGRVYDVISIDANGHYHLIEVKYRDPRAGNWFYRRIGKRIHAPYKLSVAANTVRQVNFDVTASEITLSGRGFGSRVLQPGDYTIHWVLVRPNGNAMTAPVSQAGGIMSEIMNDF